MEGENKRVNNKNSVILIYRLLDNNTDRLIVMACLQLGFTQQEVALMLGCEQPYISRKLKEAREYIKSLEVEVIL